jgi:hypothetical protein
MSAALDEQQQYGQSSQDPYGQDPYGQDPYGQDPYDAQPANLPGQDPTQVQQQGGQYGQDPGQFGRQGTPLGTDTSVDRMNQGGMPDPTQQQPGGQFDQGVAGQTEQQVTHKVDSAIDEGATRVPGGDQLAQPAEQQANSAIDNVAQQAQQEENQGGGGLGAIGEKLREMFGGGHNQNP